MSTRGTQDVTSDRTPGVTPGDSVQVAGWEAFASADRALRASPRVGEAVMRAWEARASAQPSRRMVRARWTRAAAAAAAVGVVVLGAASMVRPAHQRAVADARVPVLPQTATAPATPASDWRAVATVPNQPAPARGRERLSAAYRAVAGGSPEAPLVTLAADPPLEGESLQIVRMRVPRHALQAFGLSMGDPDVGAVVEVDLVVGEDGLPRDIRRVRLVADADEP